MRRASGSWARDSSLCDAPGRSSDAQLDADPKAGQLNLPRGARCIYGSTPTDRVERVAALAKVTRDRELALTAPRRARDRAGADARVAVRGARVRATHRHDALRREHEPRIERRCAEAGASLSVARGIIGDELRARDIVGRLVSRSRVLGRRRALPRDPTLQCLARELVVSPAPSWLPDGRGVALATSAPDIVFRLRTDTARQIRTVEGTFTVVASDEPDRPRGAVRTTLPGARSCVSFGAERRAEAYAAWTLRMQKAAESKLVCERDRLPELGVVDISSYAPFLSLERAGGGDLARGDPGAVGARRRRALGRFAAVTTMSRPELFASASAASARTMSAVASSFGSNSATPPENDTTPTPEAGAREART